VSDLVGSLLCVVEEEREERDEDDAGEAEDDDDELIDDDRVCDDCGVLLDAMLVLLLRKLRDRSEEWERGGDDFRDAVFLRREECALRFRDILRSPVLGCFAIVKVMYRERLVCEF
jgi:hypothetical protein